MAADALCVRCLIESRQPFLIGRPGMGAPEEVACAEATELAGLKNASSLFYARERATLKTLNGVLTSSDADARVYARCYWASVNASDLIVRIGGGAYMPLRKPFTVCTKPGYKHFHKTDVLLSRSGHFPARILGTYALNPWMLIADAQHPTKHTVERDAAPDHEEQAASSSSAAATTAVAPTEKPPHAQAKLLSEAFSWITALKGRTVAIVHPFNESIPKQLSKGSKALWGEWRHYVMPEGIRFKMVAAPQNLAKAHESTDWHDALSTLIQRVDAARPFDLAMIACGGLGMPLGAYLRATNASAMYNGGDLQMWFGVYGKRWFGLGKMNLSFVGAWTRPSARETPAGATAVEGGTYW